MNSQSRTKGKGRILKNFIQIIINFIFNKLMGTILYNLKKIRISEEPIFCSIINFQFFCGF